MMKGQRKANGGFELSEAPSHLIRRCQQFYGDLYAREAGSRELTKQQFTLLCALEHNDGASQTTLVEITGIDRSTWRRWCAGCWNEDCFRASGPKRTSAPMPWPSRLPAARRCASARNAADRAERALLDTLPAPERLKFVKSLSQIASAAEAYAANGAAKAHKAARRNGKRL